MGLLSFLRRNKDNDEKLEKSEQSSLIADEKSAIKIEVEKGTQKQEETSHKLQGNNTQDDRRARNGTSKDEQYVYYYIKKYFPNAINRYIFQSNLGRKFEADIYVPEINVAIEYDGLYWHKDRYLRDVEKTEYFNSIGLYVIHIRETGLTPLPHFLGNELWHRVGRSKKGLHTNEYISLLMRDISRFCDEPLSNELSIFSLSYEQYCNDLPDINSLIFTQSVLNPASCYEEFACWDYSKNGNLNPNYVPADANIKVFLKCPAGKTKHVNISSVCGSGLRNRFPLKSVDGICPFFGRPEICIERCEEYNKSVIKYINRFATGKISISNTYWLRLYVLNDDKILSFIFSSFINNRIRRSRFEQLLLEGNNTKYLLQALWPANICSCNTLELLKQAQEKYDFFYARFDAINFDKNENTRKTLIDYLEFLFIRMEPRWRGIYLNEVFCIALQKKIELSRELKEKISELLNKVSVPNLASELVEWIII